MRNKTNGFVATALFGVAMLAGCSSGDIDLGKRGVVRYTSVEDNSGGSLLAESDAATKPSLSSITSADNGATSREMRCAIVPCSKK